MSMVRRSLLEQGDGERAGVADCILIGRVTHYAIGTVTIDIVIIYVPCGLITVMRILYPIWMMHQSCHSQALK